MTGIHLSFNRAKGFFLIKIYTFLSRPKKNELIAKTMPFCKFIVSILKTQHVLD
jgi:hypothetical protein